MALRTALRPLLLCAALASTVAVGQDDDLLAPLTPLVQEPEQKRPPAKKPERKPRPSRVDPMDDLLAPLKAPTELLVNLADPMILGARLFIDGRELGLVNGQPIEVTPGDHKLLVKRAGFNDFQGLVSVPDGGREKVVVSLFPSGGVLNVAGVDEADVYVDGNLVGKAPVRELVLKPGSHEVRVVKEGFAPEVTRLAVRPGKDYNLSPELVVQKGPRDRLTPVASAGGKPSLDPAATRLTPPPEVQGAAPPWYGRWYVWAGAAAVAVAGGTVAVVASQPRTFRPEEVCGQTCSDVMNLPGARTGRRTVLFVPKMSF